MLTKHDFEHWIDGYVKAWKTSNPEDIANLFTEDALYSTGPFNDPWIGQQAIVKNWVDTGDQPTDWTFEYEVVAADGDLGAMTGTTVYKSKGTYSNVWLIRLAEDGLCKEFREWYMKKRE